MDDLKNLIDLSSPENKANETNKIQPLIPCPSNAQPLLINNPFDSICEQLQVTTDDPFEAALSTAMCYKKTVNKNQRKNSKKNSVEKGSCGDEERVSPSKTSIKKDDQVNKVSSTNDNSNNPNNIEKRSSALTIGEEDDENKENLYPCPPKELGKNNDVSSSEGKERAPLSEISIEKLYLQDESCPSFLNEVDETQPRDEIQDFLTGPLRTDIESEMKISGNEYRVKVIDSCQSVSMFIIESDKCVEKTKNSTFCGDFDGLEGFKPLGDLVNSSFSQSFVKNDEKDLLSLTCDQMDAKANFKTSSAPSLSTPNNKENGMAAHRKAVFSSELSPVLNNANRGSSASSNDRNSFMNRAMIMSNTDCSNFSFSSKKMECNTNIDCGDDDNDDVFVEAKILAQSFSESVRVDDKIDEVADLLSIELNLVHANSSDEENDSLRNDPSLNFNFTSPATRQKNIIEFSNAVKMYKKRRSTDPLFSSTDALNESQDDSCQKKSASFSSSETPKSSKSRNCTSPTSITAGLNLLKKQIDSLPIGNNIRQVQKPKKDEGGVCSQKGAPLKATVPLQFMIRSGINKDIGIDKKTVAIKPVTQGKVRAATRMKGQKNVTTPRPVASSTPNKNKAMNVSPGQSLLSEDNHNNHSLDSSDGNEQKKTARSSSLSSIPCSEQNVKIGNGKLNSTPTRNGLSIRNSMPIMKQNTKKLNTLSRNSHLGVRNSLLSPSSASSVMKYGKLPPKMIWGHIGSHRDKENMVPTQ